MIILIVLIIIFAILCFMKKPNEEENLTEVENEYASFNFYKKENQERYEAYQKKNNLSLKDIVLRVNMGLDNSFYTNTKEVKNFDKLMLVNKYNYVRKNFEPTNLVALDKYARSGMYLVQEAKEAFQSMAEGAEREGLNLRAVSTYRTYEYQANLYNNYVKEDGVKQADTYSARPGFSEHHTGLAVDVDNLEVSYTNFEKTKEFNWMQNNAYKYGFILRYPKTKENITGYMYEPWHYRFVGVEISKYIQENNLTYEEYYYEFLDSRVTS